MAEEQKKPRTLWESALKVVKGDSTEQLVEQFTAEMTLVAEGLYDDQARLKREVELLRQEQDRLSQRVGSEQQAQETALMEAQRDFDKRLDDFARRLSAMEAKLSAKPKRWMPATLVGQITLLACIVCGAWVLVTLLNLLMLLLM